MRRLVAIDFVPSKRIAFKSCLDIGPVDVVSTDDTSMSLLTQADASAARTYCVRQARPLAASARGVPKRDRNATSAVHAKPHGSRHWGVAKR
jgi:hypothetical protein